MSRIVVAEDDPHILRVISMWLTREGHEVLEREMDWRRLELLKSSSPNTLITDINMPGLDGLELLRRVRADGITLEKIIVLTNRWDHREIGQSLAEWGVEVVPKPFSPSRLSQLVENDAADSEPELNAVEEGNETSMSGGGSHGRSGRVLRELVDSLATVASSAPRRLAVVGMGSPERPSYAVSTASKGLRSRSRFAAAAGFAASLRKPRIRRSRRGYGARRVSVSPAIRSPPRDAGFLVEVTEPSAAEGDEILRRLGALAGAAEQVGALLTENDGLANEVLGSYEQLNLIFDFTNSISRITDAREIGRLLLGRLGLLLRADQTLAVQADGTHFGFGQRGAHELPEPTVRELAASLAGELDRVRSSRAVTVSSCDFGRVLLGPLARQDGAVDVVIATRAGDAGDFNSGDMLVLESLLSFGGQLIANCELHERLRRISVETTRALVSAIDKKDHYTSGHSERVGFLARLVGQALALPPVEVDVLEWTGLLHDVGKIGVPEEILNKEGPLTAEEFDEIKKHPAMGYEILKPIASFDIVLDGVLYHHENPDGSGYPAGLTGDAIPLAAGIVHVVDVFDALSSHRSYRPAFTIEKAIEIMRQEAGTKLDAHLVDAFVTAFRNFPTREPGTYQALFSHLRSDAS